MTMDGLRFARGVLWGLALAVIAWTIIVVILTVTVL